MTYLAMILLSLKVLIGLYVFVCMLVYVATGSSPKIFVPSIILFILLPTGELPWI